MSLDPAVEKLLDDLNIDKYIFLHEKYITMNTLKKMTDADLKDLGLLSGERQGLLKALDALHVSAPIILKPEKAGIIEGTDKLSETIGKKGFRPGVVFDTGSFSDEKRTEMFFAAGNGDVVMIEKLHEVGLNVNQQDKDGNTAMHFAAWNGHVACLEALFKMGGDVHAKDKYGNTPMHKSAIGRHERACLCLFEMGAKDDIRNNEGHTPLEEVIKKWGHSNLYLEEEWTEIKAKGEKLYREKVISSMDKAWHIGGSSFLPPSIPISYLIEWTDSFSEMIGRGRYGNVYKGLYQDGRRSRAIAVKRMFPNPSSYKLKIIKKSLNTLINTLIKTLSNVRHFNLIRLIGYHIPLEVELDKSFYLVYEYVERDLAEILKYDWLAITIDWRTRISIAYDVACALQHLHNRKDDKGNPILYRDLKAASIGITWNNKAKLLDLVLAPMEMVKFDLTSPHLDLDYLLVIGRYDVSCDIYSFGIVLAELFFGVIQGTQINNSEIKLQKPLNMIKERRADERAGDWGSIDCQNSVRNLIAAAVHPDREEIRFKNMDVIVDNLKIILNTHCMGNLEKVRMHEENDKGIYSLLDREKECFGCKSLKKGVSRCSDHFLCFNCIEYEIQRQCDDNYSYHFVSHERAIVCPYCLEKACSDIMCKVGCIHNVKKFNFRLLFSLNQIISKETFKLYVKAKFDMYKPMNGEGLLHEDFNDGGALFKMSKNNQIIKLKVILAKATKNTNLSKKVDSLSQLSVDDFEVNPSLLPGTTKVDLLKSVLFGVDIFRELLREAVENYIPLEERRRKKDNTNTLGGCISILFKSGRMPKAIFSLAQEVLCRINHYKHFPGASFSVSASSLINLIPNIIQVLNFYYEVNSPCQGEHPVYGKWGCHNNDCKDKDFCAPTCVKCPDRELFSKTFLDTPFSLFCSGNHSVDGEDGCHNDDCRDSEKCTPDCRGCPDDIKGQFEVIWLCSLKVYEEIDVIHKEEKAEKDKPFLQKMMSSVHKASTFISEHIFSSLFLTIEEKNHIEKKLLHVVNRKQQNEASSIYLSRKRFYHHDGNFFSLFELEWDVYFKDKKDDKILFKFQDSHFSAKDGFISISITSELAKQVYEFNGWNKILVSISQTYLSDFSDENYVLPAIFFEPSGIKFPSSSGPIVQCLTNLYYDIDNVAAVNKELKVSLNDVLPEYFQGLPLYKKLTEVKHDEAPDVCLIPFNCLKSGLDESMLIEFQIDHFSLLEGKFSRGSTTLVKLNKVFFLICVNKLNFQWIKGNPFYLFYRYSSRCNEMKEISSIFPNTNFWKAIVELSNKVCVGDYLQLCIPDTSKHTGRKVYVKIGYDSHVVDSELDHDLLALELKENAVSGPTSLAINAVVQKYKMLSMFSSGKNVDLIIEKNEPPINFEATSRASSPLIEEEAKDEWIYGIFVPQSIEESHYKSHLAVEMHKAIGAVFFDYKRSSDSNHYLYMQHSDPDPGKPEFFNKYIMNSTIFIWRVTERKRMALFSQEARLLNPNYL